MPIYRDEEGQGGDLRRDDLALERQALRNDWPIPPAVRRKILQRLLDYLDRDHEEGATAPDRTVILAARTLAQFARLSMDQQALDLRREQQTGDGELTMADLVSEAEWRAEQRRRDRAADGAAGGLP